MQPLVRYESVVPNWIGDPVTCSMAYYLGEDSGGGGGVSGGDEDGMGTGSAFPSVYIIGEDTDRVRPLLEALSARGIATQVWDTAGGCLVPTLAPPSLDAVYFCRQSPSAANRGHPHSMAYAKELLRWLEFHGARVINGSGVLDVECSKALQMMYLHAAGLNTPLTTMQQGLPQTLVQARVLPAFRDSPLIMKPNHGGSGTNVDSYASAKELVADVRTSRVMPCPDNLWVLQTHLGKYSRDPMVTKAILRFEVVDGLVQRDYVVKITAPSTEFSLCPCDPRAEKLLHSIDFRILKNPLTIPGFHDDPEAFDAFCKKVEQAFEWVGAKVGSVEGVVLIDNHPEAAAQYACPHEPVLFEMNFNTNYNASAEAAAAIQPGVERVCDLLERELEALRGAVDPK